MAVYRDITEDVVTALGLDVVAEATASAAVPADVRWDCTIGGLPFLFATSKQYPFKRETASFRRERIDTAIDPGEQSLDSGYWLRSQASWHYGSGLSSAEPLEVSEEESRFRYKTGGGIDPWTPGQMSLLNDTSLTLSSAGSGQKLIGVDSGVLHADAGVLKYVTNAGSASTVTWGGTGTILSLTSDGANYYASNATGVYKGTLPSGAGSLVWNTGSASVVTGWVKSRLMAAIGGSLYELTGAGPTLPTALFTHPTSGWTWTDFSEGPASIYVSGYSGDTSIIYKIGVNTSTTVITLNQPVVVAELPRGELVKSMYAYVGTYVVIGTSKGVRVAIVRDDGSLTFGPLVVESADGCSDAVASGSFVYVTMGTKGEVGDRAQRAGLFRIDLGANLNGNPLRFPSAADLVAASGAGACNQVTSAGGKLWFTVDGTGLFKQQDTYVAEGWAETGRIRMSTVEPKAWREVRLLQEVGTTGTVSAYATPLEGSTPSAWGAIVATNTENYDATGSLTSVAPTPQSSLYVAFKLTRALAATTPVFIGYQVRSIPAPRRSQLIEVPVMCFDFEEDRQGVRYGSDGGAWTRFNLLKQLEAGASTVSWRDYTTGESAEAYIEQVSFTRTVPPTRGDSAAGGVAQIVLRLVG